MKQGLHLKLSQHLTLTPQLQQSIRLLQLSTLELEQEIEQIMADNPLLERDDGPAFASSDAPATEALPDAFGPQGGDAPPDWSDQDFSPGASGSRVQRDNDDDNPTERQPANAVTLREHLIGQLALMRISDRDRLFAAALAEALDEDGYLTQAPDEIYAMLASQLGLEEPDPDEIGVALALLQSCEPAGVGARTLSECLRLQLRTQPASPARELASRIAAAHLDTLAARDFSTLKRACKCDDAELKAARDLILSLNPRPGARYGGPDTRYVTPDVILRKVRKVWRVHVNTAAVPRLKINRLYADILGRERGRGSSAGSGSADGGGLFTQLQEAKWLLKNV